MRGTNVQNARYQLPHEAPVYIVGCETLGGGQEATTLWCGERRRGRVQRGGERRAEGSGGSPVHGRADVSRLVEDSRGVAGADADGGLAGGVGGVHHAGAAGGKDHGDGLVVGNEAAEFEGGLVDPADDVLGGTGLDGRLGEQLAQLGVRVPSAGVGGEDDAVAGLQGDQRLEDDGGGGVGDGGHAHDDAHGLGDLGQPALVVGPDGACFMQHPVARQREIADDIARLRTR
eukprot:1195165-Prorocentrum_minimum.AAC.2